MSKFACAITCIDGQTFEPVIIYMKFNYGVDYVDMVIEHGPNRILAENTKSTVRLNIYKRIKISVQHHDSDIVAIVGHSVCAGNPTNKETQLQHLQGAKNTVKLYGLDINIILLWVDIDLEIVEFVSR